jgi:hypothetical protein
MPRILPLPWISGAHPYHGDWVTFDEDRAGQAQRERLCAVCGQPLNLITLLGRADDRTTFGPGCHPCCMQLTLTGCPYFTDPMPPRSSHASIAWRVDGPHLGYAAAADPAKPYDGPQRVDDGLPEVTAREVELLAGLDPWGTGRPATMDVDDTVSDQ